jgi:uroporphyrinogen-III synthase
VAREAGFDIAATGDQGVERLLGSIEPELRLLQLCGEDRTDGTASQAITRVVVYRSVPTDPGDLSVLHGSVGLIHSPRAGSRLAELVDDRSTIAIAAISRAAASSAGHGWMSIDAAEMPTDDALLALAARLCNKPGP